MYFLAVYIDMETILNVNNSIMQFLIKNLQQKKKKDTHFHCVNPDCPYFHNDNSEKKDWYDDHGTYETKAFGTVQRFRCLSCGKTFSTQTFSIDYYVKHPVDYLPFLEALFSTSGQGNMTRFSGKRYELIQNRYERVSRIFLALHAILRKEVSANEDFVLDGFESFSRSQYFPNNINILVGSSSEFIYGMGYSQLRRKGQMTDKQKEKRSELEELYGKAPPKSVEFSVARLIDDLCNLLYEKKLEKKIIITDEHQAYPRALRDVEDSSDFLIHMQYPSKAPRNFTNPLFPVNYVDRQFRKDQVNHVRESVQFNRCPTAMMIRLSLYQIYHNYMMPKRVREQRKGNWQTRGEFLGVEKRKFFETLNDLWGTRVFYHKLDLWKEEKKTWHMMWRNSKIKMGRRIPQYIRI